MSTSDLQSMSERIDGLEQRIRRRDRALIICVVLGIATSLLIAQAPSKRTVEAEQFILRGSQGQELASLDRSETGATLTLYDGHHRGRIALLSSDAESGAAFLGTDGKSAASIEVNGDNRPVVSLSDGQGRTRGDFAITDQGPAMRMWDSNSAMRAVVAIHDEVPMLTIGTGADPKKGSVIIASDAKGGRVLITAADGKSRSVMR